MLLVMVSYVQFTIFIYNSNNYSFYLSMVFFSLCLSLTWSPQTNLRGIGHVEVHRALNEFFRLFPRPSGKKCPSAMDW